MNLILLFLSDFWLGLLNLKNAKEAVEKERSQDLMQLVWHP